MSSADSDERELDSTAFDLPGDGDAAVLCLHGLTGTPYEVRSLGEALSRAGVRAVGPLLPGHGGDPAALRRTPYTEWLDAARAAARQLRADHDVVFGVGLSMGGLVTLHLAAERVFDAVVCVAVPLALRQPGVALARFAKYLIRELPKREGSDIRDPEARMRHPGMSVMPLAGVAEMQKLQSEVRARLAEIRVPLAGGPRRIGRNRLSRRCADDSPDRCVYRNGAPAAATLRARGAGGFRRPGAGRGGSPLPGGAVAPSRM